MLNVGRKFHGLAGTNEYTTHPPRLLSLRPSCLWTRRNAGLRHGVQLLSVPACGGLFGTAHQMGAFASPRERVNWRCTSSTRWRPSTTLAGSVAFIPSAGHAWTRAGGRSTFVALTA